MSLIEVGDIKARIFEDALKTFIRINVKKIIVQNAIAHMKQCPQNIKGWGQHVSIMVVS